MAGFPTIPSRNAVGIDWDMGTAGTRRPEQEVTDVQLNLIAWTATGLAVGVGGLVWELLRGADGAKLGGGECWNPNGNPSLSLVLATAWATGTAYGLGTLIVANGALYRCRTAGTSAGSGTGPTGTGSAITDDTVTWAYQSAGGWCVRNGTGSYTLKFNAVYPDETGVPQPLTLTVAKPTPQTTSDYHAVAQVSGVNVIDIRVRDNTGTLVDCNVLVEAR